MEPIHIGLRLLLPLVLVTVSFALFGHLEPSHLPFHSANNATSEDLTSQWNHTLIGHSRKENLHALLGNGFSHRRISKRSEEKRWNSKVVPGRGWYWEWSKDLTPVDMQGVLNDVDPLRSSALPSDRLQTRYVKGLRCATCFEFNSGCIQSATITVCDNPSACYLYWGNLTDSGKPVMVRGCQRTSNRTTETALSPFYYLPTTFPLGEKQWACKLFHPKEEEDFGGMGFVQICYCRSDYCNLGSKSTWGTFAGETLAGKQDWVVVDDNGHRVAVPGQKAMMNVATTATHLVTTPGQCLTSGGSRARGFWNGFSLSAVPATPIYPYYHHKATTTKSTDFQTRTEVIVPAETTITMPSSLPETFLGARAECPCHSLLKEADDALTVEKAQYDSPISALHLHERSRMPFGMHEVYELFRTALYGNPAQVSPSHENSLDKSQRIVASVQKMACLLMYAIEKDSTPFTSPSSSHIVPMLTGMLENEFSFISMRLGKTLSMSKPSAEGFRLHHLTVTAARDKFHRLAADPLWESAEDFARTCTTGNLTKMLSWFADSFGTLDIAASRTMLLDMLRDSEYDLDAFFLWIRGVVALDTEALMYHVLCTELGQHFRAAAPTVDMLVDPRAHLDAVFTFATQSPEILRELSPAHQLRADIIRISKFLWHPEHIAVELKQFLEKKYSWLDWMVMTSELCNSGDGQAMRFNLSYPLSGLKNGAMFVEVGSISVLVGWRGDPARTQFSGRLHSVSLYRIQEAAAFPSTEIAMATRTEGIQNAGAFMEKRLVPMLFQRKLTWTALVVVKEECKPIVLPDASTITAEFFVHLVAGVKCRLLESPIDCGGKITARVLIFPLQ